MSSATVPETAPLTRRQLRALERESVSGADTRDPVDELDEVEASVFHLPMGSAPSNDVTESITLAPRSRRELRTGGHPAPRRTVVAGRSAAPRAAILTSLGVLTIAVPLTGFVSPSSPAAAIGPMVPTQASVLDVVDTAVASDTLEGLAPTGAALQADPTALARATELASRELARDSVSACEPVSGASGMREAFTVRESPVYRPMAEGTFRNTSSYGYRWGGLHYGTDMAAAVGTPIYAIADGEVVYAGGGKEGRSGQLVIIHHVIDGQDVWSWYGHMYTNGVYVSAGDTVEAGELIAGIGNNGFSTGPHLHFELHVGEYGNHVNPLTWLSSTEALYPGQC
jgi:murein DD-endopeptidase MepM/ murein hydrolase activator NlpD